jgi:hypothetical protein
MKTSKIIALIFLLIFLDQIIKIVIYHYFFDCNVVILSPFLEFKPIFNNKGLYINNLLKINGDIFIIQAILQVIFVFLMIGFYILLKRSGNNTKLFELMFILCQSTFICAFTGYLFWDKGVLDYIYLRPLFIFDLKDMYASCFLCLLLVFIHKNKIRRFSDIRKLVKR